MVPSWPIAHWGCSPCDVSGRRGGYQLRYPGCGSYSKRVEQKASIWYSTTTRSCHSTTVARATDKAHSSLAGDDTKERLCICIQFRSAIYSISLNQVTAAYTIYSRYSGTHHCSWFLACTSKRAMISELN